MCISIIISHWTIGRDAIIGFLASDGSRTVTGDQAWGWGGYPAVSDEEYKLSVTPYILGWFVATEVDLCGYVPPCVPSWKCEVPSNGYESDGCGNRQLNSLCDQGTILPGSSNTIIIIIAAAILYYFFIMRGK